jgi:hypothetical protein
VFSVRSVTGNRKAAFYIHISLWKSRQINVTRDEQNLRTSVILRRDRNIAKSDYQLRHVCPSTRMSQLGSHRTDFHEIWYFWQSAEKIQVSLKPDNNNVYITCTIWRWILKMRNVSDKSRRENQNTHVMFNNFSLKIVPFMRCGEKNTKCIVAFPLQ